MTSGDGEEPRATEDVREGGHPVVAQEPMGVPEEPRAAAAPGRPRRPWRSWRLAAGATIVVVAALVAALLVRPTGAPTTGASIRVSGLPAAMPTRLADLMGLSPVPAHSRAPDFTLTDQLGKRVSLSSFRGRPVVLTFFDPHCVTMCPIIAQEFVDAARDLTTSARGTVFLAVNVNRHALGVTTIDAFTKEHQLDTIPTWHFLTGTLGTLRHIWSEYGIEVATRIVHGQWTVVHTTIDYFIGRSGEERFIAAPNADYHSTATHKAYLPGATFAAWGRGIALVARSM